MSVVILSAGVDARQHVLDDAALDGLVSARVEQDDAYRAIVDRVLRRPEITRIAERLGLDTVRLAEATSALDGRELAEIALRAQEVDTALGGGQSTITFSTTALILILLVAILIVVAVD
jgi:hypothetical protein